MPEVHIFQEIHKITKIMRYIARFLSTLVLKLPWSIFQNLNFLKGRWDLAIAQFFLIFKKNYQETAC